MTSVFETFIVFYFSNEFCILLVLYLEIIVFCLLRNFSLLGAITDSPPVISLIETRDGEDYWLFFRSIKEDGLSGDLVFIMECTLYLPS